MSVIVQWVVGIAAVLFLLGVVAVAVILVIARLTRGKKFKLPAAVSPSKPAEPEDIAGAVMGVLEEQIRRKPTPPVNVFDALREGKAQPVLVENLSHEEQANLVALARSNAAGNSSSNSPSPTPTGTPAATGTDSPPADLLTMARNLREAVAKQQGGNQ